MGCWKVGGSLGLDTGVQLYDRMIRSARRKLRNKLATSRSWRNNFWNRSAMSVWHWIKQNRTKTNIRSLLASYIMKFSNIQIELWYFVQSTIICKLGGTFGLLVMHLFQSTKLLCIGCGYYLDGKWTILICNQPPRSTQPGHPSRDGTVSTGESWGVNRHAVWCTSPVSMVSQCKLVSGWGLGKRRSAPCGLGQALLHNADNCTFFK